MLAESALEEPLDVANLRRDIRSTIFDGLGLQVRTIEIRRIGELIKTTSGKMSRGENAKRFASAQGGAS